MSDFLFGLMIALSVGPVALMIANHGMRAGTATGVRAAIGVAAADGCHAVVAFTIGAMLASTLASHLSLFRIVGALVLLAMGAGCCGRRCATGAEHSTAPYRRRRAIARSWRCSWSRSRTR